MSPRIFEHSATFKALYYNMSDLAGVVFTYTFSILCWAFCGILVSREEALIGAECMTGRSIQCRGVVRNSARSPPSPLPHSTGAGLLIFNTLIRSVKFFSAGGGVGGKVG